MTSAKGKSQMAIPVISGGDETGSVLFDESPPASDYNNKYLSDRTPSRTEAGRISVAKSIDNIKKFITPRSELRSGRMIQLLGIIFFACLAIAGIIVQIYTDIDNTTTRETNAVRLLRDNKVSLEMFDVSLMLCNEMEPFYEFNTGSYDFFLQKSQGVTKEVDTKLIYSENWLTDLSEVPVQLRINITSATVLRTALRAQRETRKAINGSSEVDVINFYSTIIDSLSDATETLALKTERFPGWKEFLAAIHLMQGYITFKRYTLISRKLVRENRTIESIADPVYQSIIRYYMSYNEFLKIAAVESPLADTLLRNLTDQESAKNLERINAYILVQDFVTPDYTLFFDITNAHATDVFWALGVLRSNVNIAMDAFAKAWPNRDIISISLYAIASFIVATTVVVHVIGTIRLQKQITHYHENLRLLSESFTILYDCIPNSMVRTARNREIKPVRRFEDTCVMVLDIANIQIVMSNIEMPELVDFISKFFEGIEGCLRKYNCFKVDVCGDTMALAAGVGELHAIDHCLEMVFAALEMRDVIQDINADGDEDVDINLRIGISVGQCYSRIVYLQVPRMTVVGEVTQVASAIHASCLPMKVQVSEGLQRRLADAGELQFIQRGLIDYGISKPSVMGYWVLWADENEFDENDEYAEMRSQTSASFVLSRGSRGRQR